jgi:hypothetical protein
LRSSGRWWPASNWSLLNKPKQAQKKPQAKLEACGF